MTKKEIRKLFLEKRKGLSEDSFERLNTALLQNAVTAFDFNQKHIHLFLSIEKNREPNTWLLKEMIAETSENVTWVLSQSNFTDLSLKHFVWDENSKIEENQYGIPEPLGGKSIAEEILDIVFVPLLLADKKGFRVGYGKGFYDRFLSKCRTDCIKIGLSLFEPTEGISDLNEFDIPLDFIVSPEQVLKIEK